MIDTSQDELLVTNESDDDRSRSPYLDIGNIICDCRCEKSTKVAIMYFLLQAKNHKFLFY